MVAAYLKKLDHHISYFTCHSECLVSWSFCSDSLCSRVKSKQWLRHSC